MASVNQERSMPFAYATYPYTPVLGWSISRYEVFDKCKRQYFYTYYSKHVPGVPHYKMAKLRDLTSVPLEIGSIVHDVIEAFLVRLQKSDTDIDEERFFLYGRQKADGYCSKKTFIETYYGQQQAIDMEKVYAKIDACLKNFIGSPSYSWIIMTALRGKENWMIEPAGYGETRLDGMKAYCKMDFLMPVGDDVHILDWKTGQKDEAKHGAQLKGYAAAAANNFGVPWDRIFPKIVYLHPAYDELELRLDNDGFQAFIATIRAQTQEMLAFCSNAEENAPLLIESFPMNPSPSACRQCRYQELCFPDKRPAEGQAGP
jgi:CRISPR/Cas system-associated exonuclease Cas4 (RecB family)